MANSRMILRCRWCRAEVELAKGYQGDMRYTSNCQRIRDLIENHGLCCSKCIDAYEKSTNHFQLVELYSDEYDEDCIIH